MNAAASCADPNNTPSVLLVAEGCASGGIGRYCLDLAELLGPAAALVCLCSQPTTECEGCWLRSHCEARGLQLLSIPMGAREWRHAYRALMTLWRHTGHPVLHTNGRRGSFLAQVISAANRELSFVTTVHGVLGLHARRNAVYRLVDLAACRSAAAVIAVSADTRRRLVVMGSPISRTLCVPNGLRAKDLSLLTTGARRKAGSARSGAPVRVGFLGRLSQEKGIGDFAKIATHLHGFDRSVEFLVAGDGPLRQSIVEQTRQLAGAGVLKYLGEAQHVEEVLEEVDVLIMPSRNEGLPYVLLEGMAAGCAVVAYGVGGIPEIVRDRSLGLLARPGDLDGLFRSVLRLVREPNLVRQIGMHASEHVDSHFRLEERLPMLLAAYEIARPVRRGPLDVAPSEGWFKKCV